MNQKPETALELAWAKWLKELSMRPGDGYIQIRKFFFTLHWKVPWEVFSTGIGMGYDSMGYGGGPHKHNQLVRNYVNDEEIESQRVKLLARMGSTKSGRSSQSCIAFRLGNKKKESRSMGFCMQTLFVNWFKKDSSGQPSMIIELHYRSTELTKKFLADLKFLSEYLIPRIMEGVKETPTEVRFVFGTAYISSMYYPILFQFEDPAQFIKLILVKDRRYARNILSSFRQWLFSVGNPYSFRQQANMHDFMRERVMVHWTLEYRRMVERLVIRNSHDPRKK